MDVIGFVADPLAYGFMQRGLVAAILVGIVCAVMGTFVVLKGLAFIGDAVSHAAFPAVTTTTDFRERDPPPFRRRPDAARHGRVLR